jgi:cyanophycin synthetase
MKIIETNIISGLNYWSQQVESLISLKVETEAFENINLERIRKLYSALPDSYLRTEVITHTNVGDMLGVICTELQSLAGMPCNFSIFKKISETTAYIVYEYMIEKAGIYTGEAVIETISAFVSGKDQSIEEIIDRLKQIKKDYGLGATSGYILNEVKSRNIPIRHMDAGSLVALGYGSHQKKIRTAVADTTSGIGIEMAGDKEETKNILAQANVPIPKGIIVNSEEELRTRINEVKFPIVIKPLNGNHGRGVTTHIYDIDRALFGFNIASKISEEVIVEEFIPGDDHRFLVINYKLIAVAKRSPAMITGDGKSSILKLIEETNKDPQRGKEDEHVLSPIVVDAVTDKILSEKQLGLATVLKDGETLILKDTANISAGGTATDLTDLVHPQNKFMAERIAKLFGLDICGVDIMTTAVDIPITREIGAVIEVNAGPGIRMHSNPQNGIERNVAAPIIDMLFPKGNSFTIPIIAVTGSKNKTNVIAQIAKLFVGSGKVVGYNCEDGIYIDGYQLKQGSCTDKKSLEDVLFDPMIDVAVLECKDSVIFSSGLPFKECDISIILDSKSDQIEFSSPNLRSVVGTSTKHTGYCIVNADDKNLLGLTKSWNCHVVLASEFQDNEAIHEHKENGYLVGVIETDKIAIYKDNRLVFLSDAIASNRNTQDKLSDLVIQLVNYMLTAGMLS